MENSNSYAFPQIFLLIFVTIDYLQNAGNDV